jgi:hypothetical protein
MTDPYVPVLTLILGFLAGRFLQPWRVREYWWYLRGFFPHRCPLCRAWHSRRSMRLAEHRAAGWVFICQDCYNEQYHPFQKEQSKEQS